MMADRELLFTEFYAESDDGTYYELKIKGSYRSVANATARDAISSGARVEGMLVKCLDTETYYTLSGGVGNSNWVQAFTSFEINGLDAIDALMDNDSFAVYNASGSANEKTLWSTIKSTLKTYFDALYKSTFSENTAFNKHFGTALDEVCAGNDSRLSNARTPIEHAMCHTNGVDDIQSASSEQNGVMTATQAAKLDGIDSLADVTNESNVASAGAVMDGDFASNGLTERIGAGAYAVQAVATFGRTILNTATAALARTALGLGTIATQDANNVSLTGGSISGLSSPTSDDEAATKRYVDTVATGGGSSSLKAAVADITELKALDTTSDTEYSDKCLINVEENGLYRFDRDSNDVGDDDRIVQPTDGVGRWFKMATSIVDHNNASNIQGGSTGERYHLTSAEKTVATREATAAQSGLATSTQITKLNGIATGADVTSATNIGSSIHGTSEKTTPIDADEIGIIDSAASNALKHLSFSNLFVWLWTKIVALSTKPAPVSADAILISDSEMSNSGKWLSFTHLLSWINSNITTSSATTIWEDVGAVSATPSTTKTIAIVGLDVDLVKTGNGICFVNGGFTRYGIIASYADNVVTLFLGIFDTGNTVTSIEVCDESNIEQIPLPANGLYANVDHATGIMSDFHISYPVLKNLAIGRVYAKHWVDDSGSTYQPTINVLVDENAVFSSDVEMSTSYSDFDGVPNTANYLVNRGEIVDVKVTQAAGGTPTNAAADLDSHIMGVPRK